MKFALWMYFPYNPWGRKGIFTDPWMVDVYGKCRSIFQSHGSYGFLFVRKRSGPGNSLRPFWDGENRLFQRLSDLPLRDQKVISESPGVEIEIPLSSKYLVSRCLDPQTPPEKAFRGVQIPTHEVFGRVGIWKREDKPERKSGGNPGNFHILKAPWDVMGCQNHLWCFHRRGQES